MFHNTGANAFAKNQMRLAYEDKRDLYCIEEREPEMEGRKESRRQELVERLEDLLEKRNGTPTGGSTWGHEWNQVKKMVRSKDGVRETSEGSGGWVSLSDL